MSTFQWPEPQDPEQKADIAEAVREVAAAIAEHVPPIEDIAPQVQALFEAHDYSPEEVGGLGDWLKNNAGSLEELVKNNSSQEATE